MGKASYGLVVHLLLLPTPSRDDAVAVGYRFTFEPGEDFHLSNQVRSQAHSAAACCRFDRASLRLPAKES